MRKTTDSTYDFPPADDARPAYLTPPIEGQARVRVYEADGQLPVVLATDVSGGDAGWLSNNAPKLVARVAKDHLRDANTLLWITPAPGTTVPGAFEQTKFKILANGQARYDERPRPDASPPLEPQAAMRSRGDVEALIGEKLN